MKSEQLRKSILQYAIQGKLVPQIHAEEPASELLKKIQHEKQELIKQGKIKKGKALPAITDEEKIFEIPESWEWARLGLTLNIARGGSPRPIQSYITDAEDGVNWIKIGDTEKGSKYINSTKQKIIKSGMSKSRFVTKGDFLLSNSMSFGRPYILNIDGCIHDGWLVLSDFANIYYQDYLFYLLSSDFVYQQFSGIVSGAVVNNLNSDKASVTVIPIPPFTEQQRIVDRIDKLMALVEEYEKKEIELSKLEKEFPEKLKKSILLSAIQGKLVTQLVTEEPASKLVKKIKSEKQELIKQGKIKKQKDLSVITDEEKPFDIPDSWEWVLVDDIVQKTIKRGKSPKYANRSNVLVFAQKCNTKINGIDISLAQYLDESVLSKYPQEEFMCNNDIIINSTGHGTMGRVGIFQDLDNIEDYLIVPDSHVTIIRALTEINPRYAYYYLKNKQSYFESMGDGSTNQTELKPIKIASLYFPLPPHAEQKRIVACIEELFVLVDILDECKKQPRITALTKSKDNVVPFAVVEKDEIKHKVDASSFEMAARDSDSVKPETMEKVLEQVQAYYDKKN